MYIPYAFQQGATGVATIEPFTGDFYDGFEGDTIAPVRTINQFSNGDLIVGGKFTVYQQGQANVTVYGVTSLERTTGDIVSGFTSPFTSQVDVRVVRADNKRSSGTATDLLVVGDTATPYIRFLNSDGSSQSGWPSFNGSVRAAAFDQKGGLYLGGDFTTVGGTSANRIVKLDIATKSIDTSFAYGTGFNNTVNSIDIDYTNEKILVGGNFTIFNGSSANNVRALVKLDTNASVSSGWNSVIGTVSRRQVFMCKFNSDASRIAICGDFFEIEGANAYNNAQVDGNGELLTGYTYITQEVGSAFLAAYHNDKAVFCGGNNAGLFTDRIPGGSGVTASPTWKALSTGYVDSTDWVYPNGDYSPSRAYVWDLYQQSDGTAILGGYSVKNWQTATNNGIVYVDTDGSFLG